MNVVYNMDCMDALRDMPDNAFDLCVCDPPYGDVTQGGYMTNPHTCDKLAKSNDYHLSLWSMGKPPQEYFDQLFRVSKNQIIWGGNYFQTMIKRDSQGWIVWDKENGNSNFADCKLAWTSFNRATRIFRFRWAGMLQGDMKNREKRIHPTQKPAPLYEFIYNNYANKGDKILDTHVGSGSSRIAAYNLGFDFVGYEIDPVYFTGQEKRFQDHIAQLSLFT